MIIVTTWGFLKTYLCHEVHGKDEWVMLQPEDWNSKPMSCRHCLNHTRSLKELFLRHHPNFSGLIFFLFLKHEIGQDVSMVFHYNQIHLRKWFWKSLPVKLIVFPCNHGVNRWGDANWDWDDCFLIDESTFRFPSNIRRD